MRKTILFLILIITHLFNLSATPKILLNAEPFGFGPSAAIAEIFPHLRQQVKCLSYVGYGHTLDLHEKLPYNVVYNLGKENRKQKFQQIAVDYDIFITALDFETASWAKEIGLKVIVYDPLTWYWREIPSQLKEMDLYIAQNFFGVRERIAQNPLKFPETAIVPALVPSQERSNPSNEVLVNLGGLQNHYLQNDDLIEFAAITFDAIKNSTSEKISYLTSHAVANGIDKDYRVETLSPQQVQQKLSSSKLAIMTSGLGNIYEAAAMDKKVIWLPPLNDSQGQQITLLHQHGMIDHRIDWSDIFLEDAPINYFDSQEIVMQQIASYIKRLAQEKKAKLRMRYIVKKAYEDSKNGQPNKLSNLTKTFGTDGATQTATTILNWINRETAN